MKHNDPLAPMAGDVLEPFIEEWTDRARKAQQAIDALVSGQVASRAPRVERRRIGKRDARVLVRRDGDEQRLLYGPEAKEVTVVFSADEWDAITRVVFLQHGLSPLIMPSPEDTEQEGSE